MYERINAHNDLELKHFPRRGYRIGIDVSIWFHHAAFTKGGENPELRGLFFKLVFLGVSKLPDFFLKLLLRSYSKTAHCPCVRARWETETQS